MKQGSTNAAPKRRRLMLAVDKASEQADSAGPQHEEPTECYDPYLLADDEEWLIFMEPIMCENPDVADSFAHLMFKIKEAIDSGPEGAARASFTLSDSIRLAYKYTEAHKAALRLYNLSLTGYLKPADEPKSLIHGAIKRGAAEIERLSGAGPATRAKRTRGNNQRRRRRR